MKRRLLATVIGLGMLAGCGPANQVAAPPLRTAESFSVQDHCCHRGRMFADLKLTDEQKKKIKDIFAKAHTGKRSEERQAFMALITAPTVDKQALTDAITAKLAKHDEKVDRRVNVFANIRDVLTPEQRTTLADKLQSKGKGKSLADRQKRFQERLDRLAEKLKMTDEQKAKFQAVLDAYAAGAEARQARRAAKRAALAAFVTSGDKDALRTALMAAKPDIPVAQIVDAIASLDQSQRQKMADMHAKRHAAMMGRCRSGSSMSQSEADEHAAMSDEATSGQQQETAQSEPSAQESGQVEQGGDEPTPSTDRGREGQGGGSQG